MRKYQQGQQIGLDTLWLYVWRHDPIYYRDKVITWGWYQNWTIRSLSEACRRGYLHAAIKLTSPCPVGRRNGKVATKKATVVATTEREK